MNPSVVKQIANNNQWRFVRKQASADVLEFKKMAWQIIVDYKHSIVTTILRHPKDGWTKLVRRKVDENLLTHIFHYPRVHTDKGAYKKKLNTRKWVIPKSK